MKNNNENQIELKVGDKIDIGGFITTLDKITDEYWGRDRIVRYWFYNEFGEYKYNLREFITILNK